MKYSNILLLLLQKKKSFTVFCIKNNVVKQQTAIIEVQLFIKVFLKFSIIKQQYYKPWLLMGDNIMYLNQS